MKHIIVFALIATAIVTMSCNKPRLGQPRHSPKDVPSLADRVAAYAAVDIKADLSGLSAKERKIVGLLVEAGRIVDEIFWMQTSPDAIAVRDSLDSLQTQDADLLRRYTRINYGPYDRIYSGLRFVGDGPQYKPPVAGFYPADMTKEEFESYVKKHPEQKEELESQYTVVVREGDRLKAIPYHAAYADKVDAVAKKLEEAAKLAENPTFKTYLELRAKALRTDDYYESDLAWMDIKDSRIDVVIGPIENYEDDLFNYKTAYECAVVIKDHEGTQDLQVFNSHIDGFEQSLPEDAKYIRQHAGSANVIEVVNVAYFGGDFQKGVKTIAASLPNDPRVTQAKGGKKQMFRNMMEAKFDKIVSPIGGRILEGGLIPFVDRKAFTNFVTLHEISHTLGRGYVYGNDTLSVRRALKERYSAIEECKADILGLYNNKYLLAKGVITQDQMKRAIVTYVVGLYRSLRFGAEEAHGLANLMQLNFLRGKGVIRLMSDGRIGIDERNFIDQAGLLAREVLAIEAEGDYEKAGSFMEEYGEITREIEDIVSQLKDIPRDLDTRYVQ
jgi:hypothetical protein